MKKINALRITVIILIATLGIISCSKDSTNEDAVANFSATDKESMRIYYRDTLMLDVSYTNLITLSKDFNTKLNGVDFPSSEDRNEVEDYLDEKLNDTHFNSLQDAMDDYDLLIQSAEEFQLIFQPFFTEFALLDDADAKYTMEDGFETLPGVSTPSPCQNNCMDSTESYLDMADMYFASDVRQAGYNPYKLGEALDAYFERVEEIIFILNFCMSGC